MAVFFTSDLHLGHNNIMRYSHRPGLSAEEQRQVEAGERVRVSDESCARMDAYLIDNINETVTRHDTLWILGDFCLPSGDDHLKQARRYRQRIHCKEIHFVWGNHDRRSFAELFSTTHELVKISVAKTKLVLCHYAMAVWDGSHRGTWHLYGHSHSNAEPWLDTHMPGRRSLDVGVDHAAKILGSYRPFAFEEIAALLDDRPGCWIDHHRGE